MIPELRYTVLRSCLFDIHSRSLTTLNQPITLQILKNKCKKSKNKKMKKYFQSEIIHLVHFVVVENIQFDTLQALSARRPLHPEGRHPYLRSNESLCGSGEGRDPD